MKIRTNIEPNVPRAVLLLAVFATSVYGVSAPAAAASVQHVAHRGFYEVTLGRNEPSSSIRNSEQLERFLQETNRGRRDGGRLRDIETPSTGELVSCLSFSVFMEIIYIFSVV